MWRDEVKARRDAMRRDATWRDDDDNVNDNGDSNDEFTRARGATLLNTGLWSVYSKRWQAQLLAAACIRACVNPGGEPIRSTVAVAGRDDEDVVEGAAQPGVARNCRAREGRRRGGHQYGVCGGKGGGRSPLPYTEGPTGFATPRRARRCTVFRAYPARSTAITDLAFTLCWYFYVSYSFHFKVYFFL